ncbi:hypothetical protein LTR97_005781 [Elasticomyces elasticus]|uniref:WD40 repeat-like protein n=1 Tax=Elasticomyces elasticus TaxID=574655 RepID=A0AAN7ZTY4_9PEZI|nr:hypothetical protein LTR97_005781 [Elasticomyces elasticus]KAK5721690.1 hypothetical protein LTR15_006281 [Elasticomyces elasticus]
MAPTASPKDHFPSLVSCTKVTDEKDLYDVKFYPYATGDDDSIFAVAGANDLYVCRPRLGVESTFEVLRWFKSDNDKQDFNSIAWSRDPVTRKPIICAAGATPKEIQIFDVEKGERVRSLIGHGNAVNDLAVSPLSSSLLASASSDYTVRLWNLDPEYEDQPCVAVFAGEGHRQHVLSCHFHRNGKWMLTAGLDQAVCLWAVPGMQEIKESRKREGHPRPLIVYYPHFQSTEVHANYIDTAVFFGDLIISRAAMGQENYTAPKGSKASRAVPNEILMWKIDGFDSNDEPPTEPPIPVPGKWSRSSFPHKSGSLGFQRCLTFDMPDTTRFYLRFSLLHQPNMRPILVMGNEQTKFHFWDLQKLEEGYDPNEIPVKRPTGKKGKKKGGAASAPVSEGNLDRLGELRRGESVAGSDAGVGTPDLSSTSVSFPPDRKYDLGDSFMALKAHHSVEAQTTITKGHFATAQIAWSPDGTWMVAVGDRGMMSIFHRDKSVV